MKDENTQLIAYLVEKVTKGVRKQLKGHTTSIMSLFEHERTLMRQSADSFRQSCNTAKNIRKDFAAVEMMIEQTRYHAKILAEMKLAHQDMRNEFATMRLLFTEMKQKEVFGKGLNDSPEYIKTGKGK